MAGLKFEAKWANCRTYDLTNGYAHWDFGLRFLTVSSMAQSCSGWQGGLARAEAGKQGWKWPCWDPVISQLLAAHQTCEVFQGLAPRGAATEFLFVSVISL